MRKASNKKYSIEQSPFFDEDAKIKATLKELEAGTGEDLVLAKKIYFKKDEYVKLIISNRININTYVNLSPTAKDVLYYITRCCLEYNSPTFRIKAGDIAKILNKETSVIFKSIKELVECDYIARTETKEVYWINHNYYYKGNYITEKYLIKNHETKSIRQSKKGK